MNISLVTKGVLASLLRTIDADMKMLALGSVGDILDLDWFLNYHGTKLVVQASEILGKDDL